MPTSTSNFDYGTPQQAKQIGRKRIAPDGRNYVQVCE